MRYFFAFLILFTHPALVLGHSGASQASVFNRSNRSYNKNIRIVAQSSVKVDYRESVKLFKRGQFSEAIAAFGRIISSPRTPVDLKNKALIGRSQAFLVINQPTLAISDLSKIVYNPSQAKLIGNKELILGVAFIQIKQYPLAIKHLTQAIEYLPNDGSAFSNRSVAYQALENYSAAIKDIERALELNPTPSAVFNLAVLEKDRKNFSRCYNLLSQLEQQSAGYADVYLQRGLCSKALNQHRRALEDFLRASSMDNSKAEAIENVGLMLAIMGDKKTALKYLESASSLYLQQGNIKAYESVSSHILRINK